MRKIHVLTLLVVQAAITVNLPSQSIIAVQKTTSGTSARAVTLDFRDAILRSILDEISRQSGEPIGISADAYNAPVKVNVRVRNVSTLDAVRAAIKGTGFKVQTTAAGKIMVVRVGPERARAQGVIAGKVNDAKTGKGVYGATVSVGDNTRGVTTSEDGSYRLTDVAAGTHTITVRLIGYAKQTRSVTVGEGATTTADFKLEASANVLDQVIVTGTVVATELKAVPSAITVVTAKQIEERGITRIDQLFRGDIPGLFAMNLGSASLFDEVTMFSRGVIGLASAGEVPSSSTSPIKTYLDGVELADSKYLSQIDPRSIERIEILTGPQASTIYGSNAINGVMQIFTKRGTTSRSQLSLSLLSGWVENNFSSTLTPQHDYSAQLSGLEGRLSYSAGGSWNYMGPWTPAKQTARTNAFGGTRLEIPTALGRVTADATLRRSTTQNVQRGSGDQTFTDYTENGWYRFITFSPAGLASPTTYTLYGQTLGLTLTYAPATWWSHELGIGTDASDVETRQTARGYATVTDTTLFLDQTDMDRRSLRYTTTARVPVTSFAQAMVTVGADAWQSLTSSLIVFPQTLIGPLTDVSSVSRQPGHNTGGFLQTQLGIKDRFFLTYGLRVEWNPDYGEEAQPNYAPRYGVAYTTDVGPITAKLRGSYGRSTRPPLPNQKAVSQPFVGDMLTFYGPVNSFIANPELGPEYQQGGEGGLELYFGSRASLVVTRYNQTVNALIDAPSGVDSVRSLAPDPLVFGLTCAELIAFGVREFCSSQDADGFGYIRQYQYLNIGNIRNQGWDLQGSLNMGPITTRGTYSWTKSRSMGVTPKYQTSFSQTEYPNHQPGATFQYMPEHTWALGITYARAATTVGLNLTGTGRATTAVDQFRLRHLNSTIRLSQNRLNMNFGNGYVDAVNGYALADLTASHRFTGHLEGLLQVQNVMDRYVKDYAAGSAVMGRQIKFGFRIR